MTSHSTVSASDGPVEPVNPGLQVAPFVAIQGTMMNALRLFHCASVVIVLGLGASAHAQAVDPSIASCLKAWGKHPFGPNPRYKTMATSVKVFGIGHNPADAAHTEAPALVLVNTGVNVLGGTTVELLNPNGWYCFRSNVNVMGSLNIRAHCKAHLASAHDGTTVLGSNADNKSVTVLGSTRVELVGCS